MNANPDGICDTRVKRLSEGYSFYLARGAHDRTPRWARGALGLPVVGGECVARETGVAAANDVCRALVRLAREMPNER
jgi:hypothetical protein